MKILHTSDWHLGAMHGERSLAEDQRCFIDEICDVAITQGVDVVVIAGDIYDRSVASAEAIRLYDYAMNRLCVELQKEVIVIAGNHDSADRLADCKNLLKKAGLHVLGAIEREPAVVSYKDVDFYLLPWFTEEKVKGLYPEHRDDIHHLTDAFRLVCEKCRETFVPGKKHIAVSHAFITNASVSGSDKSAEIAAVGNAQQVDADVFVCFDYVALGHIHGPQEIQDRLRYSGTPTAYSFGREEKQEKSVTIIDTETMERTVVALHPVHIRISLEGTLQELLQGNYPEKVKNGYVFLNVTDSYVGLETISALRGVYPNILEIRGKSFDSEDAGIRMTMEEFERLESDPREIFKSFCRDVMGEDPDDHQMELFAACLESEVE